MFVLVTGVGGREEPRLAAVAIVRPGSEARVKLDLLDALYPHDTSVRVEVYSGALAIFSRLKPGEVRALAERYPIRGLTAVREAAEVACDADPRAAIEALLRRVAEKGLKFARVEVRTRGSLRGRDAEQLVKRIVRELRLLDKLGAKARIEVLGRYAVLCILSKSKR
ncbi:MAG: hypothetical protein DRJ96_00150 [Thermoprotei archaeon]|nr:MAG: hypothetical protein DRJ67_01920 [Thermoprotei archaeon]RLE98782.1 MAG: hypothetical protein DRJ96_00150 [Thermoprotei archaeon]